jgi:p21-activated kinase 1
LSRVSSSSPSSTPTDSDSHGGNQQQQLQQQQQHQQQLHHVLTNHSQQAQPQQLTAHHQYGNSGHSLNKVELQLQEEEPTPPPPPIASRPERTKSIVSVEIWLLPLNTMPLDFLAKKSKIAELRDLLFLKNRQKSTLF